MSEALKKIFQISDGVAALAHKKALALVKELQKEGALTKKESQKVSKGLTRAKTKIYDVASKEMKKVLEKVETKAKAAVKKHGKKKKR